MPDATSDVTTDVPRSATSTRPLALVTGASSGIGLELSKQFVAHGFDVLMVAEDATLDESSRTVGEAATTFRADLREHADVERLWAHVLATGRPVEAVAINAGVGNAGPFVDTPLQGDLDVIALNVTSAVHLAKLVTADMVRRGRGRVLFTSSVASTMPGPYYATYAASKSFVQSFAEALRREVRPAGVTVTALMPGPTDTNFFRRAGLQGSRADEGPKDDPADVARDGIGALLAGKDHVVASSLLARLQSASGKLLPQKVSAAVHGLMTKPRERKTG